MFFITAVAHPRAYVVRTEPEFAHDVHGHTNQLSIGQFAGLPYDVHIQLKVFPQAPPLGALVAEQLWDGEPPDRLPESVGARSNHPRKGRRHLWA